VNKAKNKAKQMETTPAKGVKFILKFPVMIFLSFIIVASKTKSAKVSYFKIVEIKMGISN